MLARSATQYAVLMPIQVIAYHFLREVAGWFLSICLRLPVGAGGGSSETREEIGRYVKGAPAELT